METWVPPGGIQSFVSKAKRWPGSYPPSAKIGLRPAGRFFPAQNNLHSAPHPTARKALWSPAHLAAAGHLGTHSLSSLDQQRTRYHASIAPPYLLPDEKRAPGINRGHSKTGRHGADLDPGPHIDHPTIEGSAIVACGHLLKGRAQKSTDIGASMIHAKLMTTWMAYGA